MNKNFKCILATLSVTITIFSAFTGVPEGKYSHSKKIVANAETSGDGWLFDETTGTLTITADEVTNSWQNEVNTLDVINVIIENGATNIGVRAFYGCSNLESIEIPESVTSIGDYAFLNCTGLTEITIPESVTSISEGVFEGCKGLTEITIPKSVTSIGDFAFSNCTGLTSIEISESVESIGDSAFANCINLTSIVIPESVKSIGNSAFARCIGLTEIVIPESVESIDDSAFAECTGLETIIIPIDLDVSNVDISDNVTQIKYTVKGDNIIITDIILGGDKTEIEIPDSINGKNVIEVAESVQNKVSESGHSHKCNKIECNHKAKCSVCGTEYGEIKPHSLAKTDAVLPSCTEKGNIEYWYCSDCDKYFEDEDCTKEIAFEKTIISENGHKYIDGKCSECGIYENGIGEHLKGYSLSLKGNIGVNFYMELDPSIIADETAYMQFTLPNGEIFKIKVSDADRDGNYYIFSCEVNAKEMDDIITAQIIASNGDKVGEFYKYSVKDYIDYIRNGKYYSR